MTEALRTELMIDERGGYVYIQDAETGEFAGFDPTPEEITELAEKLHLPNIEALIARTEEFHRGLIEQGSKELLRYYPFNTSRLGSTKTERNAIPHNYLAFGEVATNAAIRTKRYTELSEGVNDE